MMNCDACAGTLPAGASFCPSCGTRVAASPRGEARETRKTVTVVFCDMVGSTELSERLDAELLRQVMLGYFTEMRDCLTKHGGTVEKFIGDAVMAVFGVPRVREDDALRAVSAAADMLAAVERLNQRLIKEMGTRIAVRIGVNTGEVVTTHDVVGGDSLVSGETVNVAARLEQHAGAGEVLLGPDTYRLAAGAILAEPVGPLRLKGKAEPVTARRLLDMNPDSPAVPSRSDVPLIGRQRELDELVGVFDRAARNRRCHVVRVSGEAGIGKSRLARDYASVCVRRGASTELGRCRPYGEGGSLAALVDAMTRLAEVEGRTLAAESADELAGTVCGLLRRSARDRPVLVILDDLQWAEPALLAAVETIAHRLGDVPVVLLCLSRIEGGDILASPHKSTGTNSADTNSDPISDPDPEANAYADLDLDLDTSADADAVSPADPDSYVTSLMLAPLSDDAARRLVGQLSEVTGHESAMADRIVSRAGGNPLFLEQLVTLLRDSSTADELPLTIRALIGARLDLITAGGREILELAAVAGRRFTLSAVNALATEPGEVTAAELSALCRLRLVERMHRTTGGDTVYRFASELIHEVTYESMPLRLRAKLHERLADWWEAREGDPTVIGAHLEKAAMHRVALGRPDQRVARIRARAFAQLALAGERALRRGDVRWSMDLLERSARLCDGEGRERLSVLTALAEARVACGLVDAGRDLFHDLRRRAAAVGDLRIEGHARLQLAYLDPESDQVDAALAVAREVLPVFEAEGDHLGMARSWLRIGQAEQSHGRYRPALTALGGAITHARLADAELERATALGAYAISLLLGPEPVNRAIGRCRGLLVAIHGSRRTAVAALSCPLAVLEAMAGDSGNALERLAQAERIVTELGHVYAMASIHVFRADIHSLADELDAAAAELRLARDASAQLGDTQLHVTASRDLARVLLRSGSRDEAVRLIGEALSGIAERAPAGAADLAGLRAQVQAALGSRQEALSLSADARVAAAATDSPACQATALLDTARVLWTLGDRADARVWAGRARRRFREKGHLAGERQAALLADEGVV